MDNLYDQVAALPGGERDLAVARLKREILATLHESLSNSPFATQAELAKALRIRRSAVNQVFKGDGNVRIETLAEYLFAMGFELTISVVQAGEPRRAVLEGRAPTPAFEAPVASSSAVRFSFPVERFVEGVRVAVRAERPLQGSQAAIERLQARASTLSAALAATTSPSVAPHSRSESLTLVSSIVTGGVTDED